MSKCPPVSEIEFLRICKNHGALTADLEKIGVPAQDIREYAKYICEKWYQLSLEHLQDAKKSLDIQLERATFSRAYYAAYNASKAVRYIVKGAVSLAGDDHKAAPLLPDDFPDAPNWSALITRLYEHRLRADYDNWDSTAGSRSLDATEAVQQAELFAAAAKEYIDRKYGAAL